MKNKFSPKKKCIVNDLYLFMKQLKLLGVYHGNLYMYHAEKGY